MRFGSLFATSCLTITVGILGSAQQPVSSPDGRPTVQTWWVSKTPGGVYKSPMRPIWRLSDLKQMHAGQDNWQEQIILDPEQDATYNSGAVGAKYGARMHPDTPTVFVVISGQVRFNAEKHESVNAVRGAIINIPKSTVFSYEIAGDRSALWIEVNPTNYKTVYPTTAPGPPAGNVGTIVKVSFNHEPAQYRAPNRLMFNTFTDVIEGCKVGVAVLEDHLFASPLLGYVNPADNKCGTGGGNIGGGPAKPGDAAFNPQSVFGHMHAGPAEWWIVQVGQIGGRFENTGEFHAVEGDVLYAPPMTWHQMAAEAPNGPSVRLAMGGYRLVNMTNTGSASEK